MGHLGGGHERVADVVDGNWNRAAISLADPVALHRQGLVSRRRRLYNREVGIADNHHAGGVGRGDPLGVEHRRQIRQVAGVDGVLDGLLDRLGHVHHCHRRGKVDRVDGRGGGRRGGRVVVVELKGHRADAVVDRELLAIGNGRSGRVGHGETEAHVELVKLTVDRELQTIVELFAGKRHEVVAAQTILADLHVAGGAEIESQTNVVMAGVVAQIDDGLPPVLRRQPALVDQLNSAIARDFVSQRRTVPIGIGGQQVPIGPAVGGDEDSGPVVAGRVFRLQVIVEVQPRQVSSRVTGQAEGRVADKRAFGPARQIVSAVDFGIGKEVVPRVKLTRGGTLEAEIVAVPTRDGKNA